MTFTTRVSGDGLGVELAVYGLQSFERALRQFNPAVAREMDRSIRQALVATRSVARSRIPDDSPMKGWRTTPAARGRSRGGAGWPAWDASAMRSGIQIRKGQARGRGRTSIAVAWRLESSQAAATIFDKAAVGRTSVGQQFIANLNQGNGKAQRVLWPAWLATRRLAIVQIEDAIGKAQRAFQSQIDAIDSRGAA